MENEDTKINSLSKRRFTSIIFLFRLGGIPFKIKKISTIYAVYMATLIFCSFTSYVGMLINVFVHWDNFGTTVTTLHMLIPFTNDLWVYTYCRYVRKLIIIVTLAQVFVSRHNITVTSEIK